MEGGQATAPRGSERAAAIRSRLAEILGEPRRRAPPAERRRLARDLPLRPRRARARWSSSANTPASRPASRRARRPCSKPPRHAGVPVAAVVAHGREDPVLGAAWTLVEAVPGHERSRRRSSPPRDAGALLEDIAAALAAVHRMPAERGARAAAPRSRSRSCARSTITSASPTPSSSWPSARSGPTGRRSATRSCTATSGSAT